MDGIGFGPVCAGNDALRVCVYVRVYMLFNFREEERRIFEFSSL